MGFGSKKDAHKDIIIDTHAKDLLQEKTKNGIMACATAFDCTKKLNQTRQKTGIYLDILEIRLEKCQIGLFGHGGEKEKGKKFLKLTDTEKKEIKSILDDNMKNDFITCSEIWALAEKTGTKRMKISTCCEESGIKIKGCQLGAF